MTEAKNAKDVIYIVAFIGSVLFGAFQLGITIPKILSQVSEETDEKITEVAEDLKEDFSEKLEHKDSIVRKDIDRLSGNIDRVTENLGRFIENTDASVARIERTVQNHAGVNHASDVKATLGGLTRQMLQYQNYNDERVAHLEGRQFNRKKTNFNSPYRNVEPQYSLGGYGAGDENTPIGQTQRH